MKNLIFWEYLAAEQQDLLQEGHYLYQVIKKLHKNDFKDYSFLVFPFAKAYEGYLKYIFTRKKFISHLDYISDHFKLGKLLSPSLEETLGDKSIFRKIAKTADHDLANDIWITWNEYRNKIFHYYPHNNHAVNFIESELAITQILRVMSRTYKKLLT